MAITKYDIASIAATNDLEDGDWHKLAAVQQRELFGANILGRKDVSFDSEGQGTVRVAFSKAFGTDCTVVRLSYEQFAEHCNEQRKIEE